MERLPQARLARPREIDQIVELSSRVQAALSATGSVQHIGLLKQERVMAAIEGGGCFVLEQESNNVVGCVFIRSIMGDSYPDNDLDISAFPSPRLFLQSLMLTPEVQGKGLGREFFNDVMGHLHSRAGTCTVLLDCWAENNKLRAFYLRAGCELVAEVPEDDYEIAVFARVLNSDPGGT